MTDSDSAQDLLDVAAVERWLDDHVPSLGGGPLRATKLTGGATNIVFVLERDGNKAVLRRPPRVPRPDSEKILGREARVLRALNDTDVRAPRLLGHCDDATVNGTAFYVMTHIDGWVALGSTFPPPFDKRGGGRRDLAFRLIEGIATLANVDYRAVGLEDFGKPDKFLERQVDRWMHQLDLYRTTENYQGRDLPGLAYVGDWLKDNLVETPRVGIIHGDYGFANAMFAHGEKAELKAMIDWELSTIGDPLLDLGWVIYGFRSEKDPPGEAPLGYFDPSIFPTREEMVAFYADRTGLPVGNLDYYIVLAQFKLAVLLERKYAESLIGRQSKEYGEMFGKMVIKLLGQAQSIARAARF
ncbi:phosphotransferase family protein [uncultured Sphingomonas sp.]|uniref:phosphotransferase family protein n=1 Tax=uncultured Sphingomonas sp. TaxID=158754 RepID=UPI0035CA30E7